MARTFDAKLVEAGLSRARTAFKRLPDVAREELNEATEDTAVRILSGARQRVAPHRRYGFLEKYLAYSMNPKTGEGRVGLPRRAAVVGAGMTPNARRYVARSISRKGKTTFDVYGHGTAAGAKVIYPSKYAHLVEFGHDKGQGHSSAPPSPFMIPAAEAARAEFLRRCREGGARIERDLSVSRFQ